MNRPNAAETRYHDLLRTYGCMLCRRLGRSTPDVSIHHPRIAAGAGQRASHWLAIPLCRECHQGDHGIHGDRQLLIQVFGNKEPAVELELVGDVIAENDSIWREVAGHARR